MVFALTDEITFPDPHYGDPYGLLAVGGASSWLTPTGYSPGTLFRRE